MPEAEGLLAPLDAYATAKPDEPVFTLQGGDPFGGPIARLWAHLARARAIGVRIDWARWNEYLEAVVQKFRVLDSDERESKNLLIRATQAECVSWDMDEYLKRGGASAGAEEAKSAAENSLDEKTRLDLHDTRVHAASRLRNMVFELIEIDSELAELEFFNMDDSTAIRILVGGLQKMSDKIEPRRVMKEPLKSR